MAFGGGHCFFDGIHCQDVFLWGGLFVICFRIFPEFFFNDYFAILFSKDVSFLLVFSLVAHLPRNEMKV